jgi:sugar lactone lactonase YvrE
MITADNHIAIIGGNNNKVVKYDLKGRMITSWGTPGTGNGQFNTVHAIDIDKDRKLYVSDRGNGRIQIFDENGKYLDQFGGLRQPQHVMITADNHIAIIGGNNNKVVKYDLKGRMITSWGTQGTFPGAIWNPHQFSVDTEGNLYIAEATGGRTQKFRPRQGADKNRLIGPPQPLMRLSTN